MGASRWLQSPRRGRHTGSRGRLTSSRSRSAAAETVRRGYQARVTRASGTACRVPVRACTVARTSVARHAPRCRGGAARDPSKGSAGADFKTKPGHDGRARRVGPLHGNGMAAKWLISGKQIKDGTISGKDIKDGSIKSADLATGAVTSPIWRATRLGPAQFAAHPSDPTRSWTTPSTQSTSTTRAA